MVVDSEGNIKVWFLCHLGRMQVGLDTRRRELLKADHYICCRIKFWHDWHMDWLNYLQSSRVLLILDGIKHVDQLDAFLPVQSRHSQGPCTVVCFCVFFTVHEHAMLANLPFYVSRYNFQFNFLSGGFIFRFSICDISSSKHSLLSPYP